MDTTKAPCNISRNLKLSNGKYNVSESEVCEVKGGVFKDCKYAWTSCKTELRLFRMSVGNKIATWRFGGDVSQSESVTEVGQELVGYRVPHVTCVCELPARGAVTGSDAPQLLVGLDCGPGRGGAVCICDSSSGSIIATINVLHPVSSLAVIDGGASPASRLLSPAITNMCGVAAVGLTGCGYVMLVDLRRHDPDGPHTTILLNEDSFKVPRKFALMGSDGKVRCFLPSFKVDVTCLQYVPCITSLLVGYNFGCFEIWDLKDQKIRYVSPVMEQTIPVAHIAFQEPSDDPRNFCYVWAVHSPSGEISENSSDACHPVAFMYALCYQWKEWVDGCGYIYEDFKGCSQHYFFEMKTFEDKETLGGSSITCQAVGTAVSRQHRSLGPDDFDDSVNEGELSLCLFAWQTIDTDCKSLLRVALFDLDRWYKEEMPQSGNGSYIVVFHLEDTLRALTNPVLDVVVDESSLQPYRSDTGHEEYYRPSALSFVSQILFEEELVEINHPGEQQFLLSHLDKSGPLALLHPAHLYKHCLSIGLRPALFDIPSPSSDVSLDQQRRFLLALALEWQMSGFLHSCAVEWASGSQSVAGCSLPVLLAWGWEFALAVKDEASKLCTPLFDHSGTKLDRAGRRMLSMYRNQLGHLAKLFRGVLTSNKIPKIYVPDCVEKQAKALEMISLYFEVVQWFMNAGLLPEFPDDGVSYGGDLLMEDHHKLLPYPASVIKKYYEDRRADEVPLFVDLLLEQDKSQKLKQLWVEDGGSGYYPPPSLQALLQTYLIDVLDTTAKHRFVIYVFLDLAETLDDRYAGAINYLIKFPAAFYMRPSTIKITQAMWLLDHKDFEEALRMLLDPMIRPIDLEQWQHRAIALAFLKQGKADLALDYIVCRNVPLDTFEDVKLKISILIENKKVLEAYECQSMYSVGESNQELMEFFLCELQRAHLLNHIFYLTLTPTEEKCFFQFLEKHGIQYGGTKVIYYLQHCRIIEAFETADILERQYNQDYFNGNVRSIPFRYVAKSVEGLPEITRKTADVYKSANALTNNAGTIPEPLSMTLYRQKSSDRLWDRSTGIETILRKIKETWVPELVNDADSLVQKTPFLFSPFNVQMKRHYNSTRAVNITEKKRAREDEERVGTPAKRRRMEEERPVNNSSIMEEPHQCPEVDVSLLLDTPRIKRLSEVRTAASSSFSGTPVREMSTRHSILKVHSVSKKSLSPEDAVNEDINRTTGRAISSDPWTEPNTDCEKTEEKRESEAGVLSANRQIRFALPKESNLDRRKSIMGASPRKPLYKSNVPLTKDSQVEERRPGDTARPLRFFPKPSSATRDPETSLSKTVNSAKKVERALSFSPSPRKRGSANRDENGDSRVAAIKGKYFFPPKPKTDDDSDSEENREDSFVSATSDVGSNAEDSSGDTNLSPAVAGSGSKDLRRDVSASTKLAECFKLADSVQSVDDHTVKEQCVETDNSPRSSLISPRISKRESYRKTNVSVLTDHTKHGVGSSKLPKSPSNDLAQISTQAIDDNSPQTSHVCVSFEAEGNTSNVIANKKSIVSFSHSSVTHSTTSTRVHSRRTVEMLSTVAGQKTEDDKTITAGAPSHLETHSSFSHVAAKQAGNTNNKADKDSSKLFGTFLSENAARITPGKTSSRQADERRESPENEKQTEKTVFIPVEDAVVSESSLMGIGKKKEDGKSTMSERARCLLPDAAIHNRHDEIVYTEQLGVDVSSASIVKGSERCVSFNVTYSPKFDKSSVSLADIGTEAASNENSVQNKSRSRLITSFFPKSSSYHSPAGCSSRGQSAGQVRHPGDTGETAEVGPPAVTRASAGSTPVLLPNGEVTDSTPSEDLQKSADITETVGDISATFKKTCRTPVSSALLDTTSYLPDTTVWNTPSDKSCTRRPENDSQSVDNTKSSESVSMSMEETLETSSESVETGVNVSDISFSPTRIRAETGGHVSSTPKNNVSSFLLDTTSYLPDNTRWISPTNSSGTRHSENKRRSADDTETSVSQIMEESSETDKSSTSLMQTSIEGEGNTSGKSLSSVTGGNISPTFKKTCGTHNSSFLPDTTSYLPDTTVWITPTNKSCTRNPKNESQSVDNTKSSESSVLEETIETDKSTSSENVEMEGNVSVPALPSTTGIGAETRGHVSSTPKNNVSSFLLDTTSFLPDNTRWISPTNSPCTRHTENEPQSADDTKMTERSVSMTMEATLETVNSSTSLVGAETGGNISPTPQRICSSPVASFLPNTTTWDSPSQPFDNKKLSSERSPPKLQENSQNVTVTIEDSFETEADRKSASRYLLDDTNYDSSGERDPVEDCLPSGPRETGKSVDRRKTFGVGHTYPENKEAERRAADEDDDDDEDDEDWHASANEEEEDSDEADEEPVVADNVIAADVDSFSSSSASIILISSTSSPDSSESGSSDNEAAADERKVCHSRTSSMDFDPLVDPESDTAEEVAAAAVPLKEEGAESAEECRSQRAERERLADTDAEPRDNSTRDVVTEKAKEAENVDIQCISPADGKVSENVSTAESQNVYLKQSEEECRSQPEVLQTPSAECERLADTDAEPRDNTTRDVVTERAKEAENLDIRSISPAGGKVSENVSTAESQNVYLKQSEEECRSQLEVLQTPPAECERLADTDAEPRDNSTRDVVTERANEAENLDIRSISTAGGKVSENVSTAEPSDACSTSDGININKKRSRKGLSERQLSRCSSEPPANVETLRKPRAKKTRSTDSLNKLAPSSAISETSTDKVSQTKDEAKHSATAEVVSEGRKNNVVDDSPNAGKQDISDLPELPNESVADDIRKSIQEWMNSPVVTRAGFRRLSSIQSEPPQMDDVSDIVSQPRTRRKKTSSVIMESTSSKKRDKYQSHPEESARIGAARSEAESAEHEQQMEEYTTERRLTRYQRSLLARSADLAAGRGRSTQSHELKTLSIPPESPVRSRSSSRLYTPSPGDADNVSVAHSEDSEVSSSLTTSSFLQRSPRSARSEDVTKRSTRRNRNPAVHSPSSVRSVPVGPVLSRRGRLRQVKEKGGELSEELQKDVPALHRTRRTKSQSALDASKRKQSPSSSHEDLQAKGELRVTRSVARQVLLQPIPEESTSSADASNKQPTPPEQRKRKHQSRSPVAKETSPRSKKQESTRISPRKAMRLRSRLLK